MERYRNPMVPQYYRDVDGVMLVYDVTRLQTLRDIEEVYLAELHRYCRELEQVCVLLIGNKLDRAPEERQVSGETGQLLANKHSMSFIEMSAIDLETLSKLEKAVCSLAQEMLRRRQDSRVLCGSSIRLERETSGCGSSSSSTSSQQDLVVDKRRLRDKLRRIASRLTDNHCECT